MQIAGICTAAIGYWKEGDSIHLDYDTLALRDVAKLYAKYDALYKAPQRQPLTEFQLDPIWRETCPDEHFCSQYFDFAKAIEAAHGIGEKT